jgi:NitT/TauT family transport system substrate-binding protein|tara:strand:+ start:872 stop:1810 length:939 start_codon:yes stop_codon:yes gene_type:complete
LASNSNRLPLRLLEVIRTLFYTPIYVSVAGGFLEKEGLDVDFKTCPPEFGHPINALNIGEADIVQSGIMRCIIASDWGAETVPKHFAEINSRDGFFVISRSKQDPFQWESLKGAKLIPVDFSPMPWASLQTALRRHNIDPAEINLVTGLNITDAMTAFRAGEAEYIHVPQPWAEQLLEDGSGHVVIAVGPENGHVCFSSFAATNHYLETQSETVHRFTVGYANALEWLSTHNAAEVGQAVKEFFPGDSLELVVKSVTRLKAQENWPTDPTLTQPAYEGLHDILLGAGMAKLRQPFSKVVRTDIVESALASRK